jgi:vacuolar-type H+-ATPase subunit F/Vma7
MAGAMRMIAVGSAALTEGFALLGFETLPDADFDDVMALLSTLRKQGEHGVKALVMLEHTLARGSAAALEQMHCECSNVVVVEVPPLHAPEDYHPSVEQLVAKILGPAALALDDGEE